MIADGDIAILNWAHRSVGRVDVATDYFLRGFVPLPWQYAYHQIIPPDVYAATQFMIPNMTVAAGIASGKTKIAAASNMVDCLSLPYFLALNTSVTAKQAELAFDMCMDWIEGNDRLEPLVADIRLRPWPIIKFVTGSEYEFRTAGQDARYIRGDEYDRITFDECGLDFSGAIIKVLRGRLRGTRVDGQKRMSRLDCISSPTDSPWFVERFDRGDPKRDDHTKDDITNYLAMRIETRKNTYLTESQIAAMEAEYTEEERRVEMLGYFPDYGLAFFPKSHVEACMSQAMYDTGYTSFEPETGKPKPGWFIDEHPRHGIVEWEMPYDNECTYVMAGDPGMDGPPKRNAGVVGVLNISKKPAELAYLAWVDGKGSYNPWIEKFHKAIRKYKPMFRYMDTTGTQAGIQELAFTNLGIDTDNFHFSSARKNSALNFLNDDVVGHSIVYPPIKGLIRQMKNYNPKEDRETTGLPQDIVMTLAMLSFGKAAAGPDPQGDEKSYSYHGVYRRGSN